MNLSVFSSQEEGGARELVCQEKDDSCAILATHMAVICCTSNVVEVRSAGRKCSMHVGHLGLNQLKLTYSGSKLAPLVCILKGGVAASLHESNW